MSEHTTEKDAPTWREVAAAYPSTVQAYVQANGPLPDGPVTEEAWETFRAWCDTPPEAGQP